MFNGFFRIREPKNEPALAYEPGSAERAELKARLQEMLDNPIEVPMIITMVPGWVTVAAGTETCASTFAIATAVPGFNPVHSAA